MCVAVPGRILSIEPAVGHEIRAKVTFGSDTTREVDLAMVPDAEVNDYVIVHSGFAVRRIPADSAVASLDLFRQVDESVWPGARLASESGNESAKEK